MSPLVGDDLEFLLSPSPPPLILTGVVVVFFWDGNHH